MIHCLTIPRRASLALFLALALSTGARAQPRDLAARIDSIAESALINGPIAGLSVAVMQNGVMLHAQGYGVTDVEQRLPATAETVYNIASVAKILTAVAVLKLVGEGRLDLDAYLTTLLPTFPNRGQGRQIKLRQLLNHTSGLSDYVTADVERGRPTREPLHYSFVFDFVRGRALDFEPGTHWIYSNTGFYLAGLIIERVTGQEWGEYVIGAVARPLGLSSIALCDSVTTLRTVGYEVAGDGFTRSMEDSEQGVRGDAGLCANALDLVRLPGALMTSGLLSQARINELLQPTLLANGVRVDYGLGVARGMLDGHPLWGHLGGNTTSYVSTLAHYPEDDLTISVLVNSRAGNVGALMVEAEVARAVLDLGTPALADSQLTADAQQPYPGTYSGDRGPSRFSMVSDGVRIERMRAENHQSRLTLHYQGDHTFARADWPMDRFVFHVAGERALAYSVYYNGIFDGFYRRTDP